MILLLAFILVPIIEIALLIKVGGFIGLWPTLIIVIATAFIGSWLLRSQGWSVFNRAQKTLEAGTFPARELFDGLCLIVAGVLLLTPGFATDALGLVLFVPGLRLILARALWQMLLRTDSVRFQFRGGGMDQPHHHYEADDKTIEGEYRNIDDDRRPDDENRP
ncbi:MAG: FxsA family protein [Alphaproteobacteria bacterium]